MPTNFRNKLPSDPADWILITASWAIYLAGIVYIPGLDSSWVYIALAGLPVFITAWILGRIIGGFSSLVSMLCHMGLLLIQRPSPNNIQILFIEHLIGFCLLALAGLFIGHLRDLQTRSHHELLILSDQNHQLSRLSGALEATNQLTIDLISSQNWILKLPPFLTDIGNASGADHLVMMQITGNSTENFLVRSYHYWADDKSLTDNQVLEGISPELNLWIGQEKNGVHRTGDLKNLAPELRDDFNFSDRGIYMVFPIFAKQALWGYLGFENNQSDQLWQDPEINTFRNIVQSLGSVIYKKLMEEHLDLRAKELDSLQKSSSNISSSDQIETSLHTVLSQILDLTPAYDTSVFLVKNHQLNFIISLGKNRQQSLPFSHPGELELSRLVCSTNQDLYISDLQQFNDIPAGLVSQHEAVIAFSLRAASEVIGILNIWYDSPQSFAEEDKTILRLLADQAASAIINVQYLQAEREQRILAESLRKANLLLSENLELKQVLERILKQVLNLVAARDSQIFLYDGKTLEFGAVMYAPDVQPDPVHPPEKDSLFYKTATSGEQILVPDIQAEKDFSGNWKTGSLVSLPLIFHKAVIGIMNITFFQPGKIDDQLLQVLYLLSNQAAIAINNARTYEAEREQRRLAQALQHTGKAIQSSLDLEVVLDQILNQISTVIPYHSANLILIENGKALVVRQQGYDKLQPTEQIQEFLTPYDVTRFITLEKMTISKEPIIIPDTEKDPSWIKTATTENILSWAGAPILDGEKVIGFLSLNNQTRNFYRFDQAGTLTAFASQAAIALVHARLHKEIQEMAITDPLTGIFNRRGLDRWGQYEIDRAKRFFSPLAAIYFDLDHFKEINDTYGHDAGDHVLQQVVSCCQAVVRKIDIFARIGGEEFLIILPETSLPIAIQIAERLRDAIATCQIMVHSQQISISISLGVVQLTDEINDLPELINAADQYMYISKQSGRNRSSYPTT